MNANTNPTTTRIPDMLAATGENYTTKTTNHDDYGTTYEVTKHDSDKTLYITQVEDDLTDMILYDGNGTTIATCTLFSKATANITPETLTHIITACL